MRSRTAPAAIIPPTALYPALRSFRAQTVSFTARPSYGGANGDGTVFRMTTNGASVGLGRSIPRRSGSVPYGGLVQGRDGNFYGTTWQGGVSTFPLAPRGGRTARFSN